jgi:hypothetical protein
VKAAERVWSRWRRRKRGNVEVGENGEVVGRRQGLSRKDRGKRRIMRGYYKVKSVTKDVSGE